MWKILGIMSGSSLDGLDFCFANFDISGKYEIIKTKTIEYESRIHNLLRNKYLNSNSIRDTELNSIYSHYLGEIIKKYIESNNISPDIIAIHGHTIYHRGGKYGYSFQLGDGEIIRSYVNSVVITNFRNRDIGFEGQGAPLVPVGEYLLFNDYKIFLNLGGIANLSVVAPEKNKVFAYDIVPVNQILNLLVRKLSESLEYDKDGENAKKGKINDKLLNKLLYEWEYLKLSPPKSLSNTDCLELYNKFLCNTGEKPENLLRTYVEFISVIISREINLITDYKEVFTTGGGAYNKFLIELINSKLSGKELYIPEDVIVEYKEALIFGFLGLRSYLGLPTVFRHSTGCVSVSSGGSIHK